MTPIRIIIFLLVQRVQGAQTHITNAITINSVTKHSHDPYPVYTTPKFPDVGVELDDALVLVGLIPRARLMSNVPLDSPDCVKSLNHILVGMDKEKDGTHVVIKVSPVRDAYSWWKLNGNPASKSCVHSNELTETSLCPDTAHMQIGQRSTRCYSDMRMLRH
ncbi:hypothetical protein BJ165DRAFT_1406150 [Panaeolus papilionaceus]|nr:hypothetical protein BJ165DRAFT_1406150 [Panaeolus papilionaceus]